MENPFAGIDSTDNEPNPFATIGPEDVKDKPEPNAFTKLNSVNKPLRGEGLGATIKYNWRKGYLPIYAGKNWTNAMFDKQSDMDAMAEDEKLNLLYGDQLGNDPSAEKFRDAPLNYLVSKSARMAPFMWEATLQGLKWAVPMTGAAAVVGQAPVLNVLPEELITMPKAFEAGMKIGVIQYSMDVEGGNIYGEMIKRGINRDKAKTLALAGGLAIGVIETMQLSKLAGPYKKIFSKAGRAMVKHPIAQKALGSALRSYLEVYGTEVGEELIQGIVERASYILADAWEGNVDRLRAKDLIPRLTEGLGTEMKEVMAGMSLLPLPGAALTGVHQSAVNSKKASVEAARKQIMAQGKGKASEVRLAATGQLTNMMNDYKGDRIFEEEQQDGTASGWIDADSKKAIDPKDLTPEEIDIKLMSDMMYKNPKALADKVGLEFVHDEEEAKWESFETKQIANSIAPSEVKTVAIDKQEARDAFKYQKHQGNVLVDVDLPEITDDQRNSSLDFINKALPKIQFKDKKSINLRGLGAAVQEELTVKVAEALSEGRSEAEITQGIVKFIASDTAGLLEQGSANMEKEGVSTDVYLGFKQAWVKLNQAPQLVKEAIEKGIFDSIDDVYFGSSTQQAQRLKQLFFESADDATIDFSKIKPTKPNVEATAEEQSTGPAGTESLDVSRPSFSVAEAPIELTEEGAPIEAQPQPEPVQPTIVKKIKNHAMSFKMKSGDNLTGQDTTTVELCEQGKRTSTTRAYSLGAVGDIVTFEHRSQKYEITKVNQLTATDVASPAFMKKLAKTEQWNEEALAKLRNQVRVGSYVTHFKRVGAKEAVAKALPKIGNGAKLEILKTIDALWRRKIDLDNKKEDLLTTLKEAQPYYPVVFLQQGVNSIEAEIEGILQELDRIGGTNIYPEGVVPRRAPLNPQAWYNDARKRVNLYLLNQMRRMVEKAGSLLHIPVEVMQSDTAVDGTEMYEMVDKNKRFHAAGITQDRNRIYVHQPTVNDYWNIYINDRTIRTKGKLSKSYAWIPRLLPVGLTSNQFSSFIIEHERVHLASGIDGSMLDELITSMIALERIGRPDLAKEMMVTINFSRWLEVRRNFKTTSDKEDITKRTTIVQQGKGKIAFDEDDKGLGALADPILEKERLRINKKYREADKYKTFVSGYGDDFKVEQRPKTVFIPTEAQIGIIKYEIPNLKNEVAEPNEDAMQSPYDMILKEYLPNIYEAEHAKLEVDQAVAESELLLKVIAGENPLALTFIPDEEGIREIPRKKAKIELENLPTILTKVFKNLFGIEVKGDDVIAVREAYENLNEQQKDQYRNFILKNTEGIPTDILYSVVEESVTFKELKSQEEYHYLWEQVVPGDAARYGELAEGLEKRGLRESIALEATQKGENYWGLYAIIKAQVRSLQQGIHNINRKINSRTKKMKQAEVQENKPQAQHLQRQIKILQQYAESLKQAEAREAKSLANVNGYVRKDFEDFLSSIKDVELRGELRAQFERNNPEYKKKIQDALGGKIGVDSQGPVKDSASPKLNGSNEPAVHSKRLKLAMAFGRMTGHQNPEIWRFLQGWLGDKTVQKWNLPKETQEFKEGQKQVLLKEIIYLTKKKQFNNFMGGRTQDILTQAVMDFVKSKVPMSAFAKKWMRQKKTPSGPRTAELYTLLGRILSAAREELIPTGINGQFSESDLSVNAQHWTQEDNDAYSKDMIDFKTQLNSYGMAAMPTVQEMASWVQGRERLGFWKLVPDELKPWVLYYINEIEVPVRDEAVRVDAFGGSNIQELTNEGYGHRVALKTLFQADGGGKAGDFNTQVTQKKHNTWSEFYWDAKDGGMNPVTDWAYTSGHYVAQTMSLIDKNKAIKTLSELPAADIPGWNLVMFEKDFPKDWKQSKITNELTKNLYEQLKQEQGFAEWEGGKFNRPWVHKDVYNIFHHFGTTQGRSNIVKAWFQANYITKRIIMSTPFKYALQIVSTPIAWLGARGLYKYYGAKLAKIIPGGLVLGAKELAGNAGKFEHLANPHYQARKMYAMAKHGLPGFDFGAVMGMLYEKTTDANHPMSAPVWSRIKNAITGKLGVDKYAFNNYILEATYDLTSMFYDMFVAEGRSEDDAAIMATGFVGDVTGLVNRTIYGREGELLQAFAFARDFTMTFFRQVTGAAYPLWKKGHDFRAERSGAKSALNPLLHGEKSLSHMERLSPMYLEHLTRVMLWKVLVMNTLQYGMMMKWGDDDEKKKPWAFQNPGMRRLQIKLPHRFLKYKLFRGLGAVGKATYLPFATYVDPIAFREANQLLGFTTQGRKMFRGKINVGLNIAMTLLTKRDGMDKIVSEDPEIIGWAAYLEKMGPWIMKASLPSEAKDDQLFPDTLALGDAEIPIRGLARGAGMFGVQLKKGEPYEKNMEYSEMRKVMQEKKRQEDFLRNRRDEIYKKPILFERYLHSGLLSPEQAKSMLESRLFPISSYMRDNYKSMLKTRYKIEFYEDNKNKGKKKADNPFANIQSEPNPFAGIK